MTFDRQTFRLALVLCVAALGLAHAEAPVPYDFTGHWAGTATTSGVSIPLVADFSGTQTFTGAIGFQGGHGQFISCSVQGLQKKKVILPLDCTNGSKGKAKGKLDPTARTITGHYHSTRPGHHGSHGKFMLTSPGACVPTGQDCTDATTGGGESAVCCNGDCQLGTNPDGSESHSCN